MKVIQLETGSVERSRVFKYDENKVSIHIDDHVVFRSDDNRIHILEVCEVYREPVIWYDLNSIYEVIGSFRLDSFKNFCINNDICYKNYIRRINIYQVAGDKLCFGDKSCVVGSLLPKQYPGCNSIDIVHDCLSDIDKYQFGYFDYEYFTFIASTEEIEDMDSCDIFNFEGKDIHIYSKRITDLVESRILETVDDVVREYEKFDFDKDRRDQLDSMYNNMVYYGNNIPSIFKDNGDLEVYPLDYTWYDDEISVDKEYEDKIEDSIREMTKEYKDSRIYRIINMYVVFTKKEATAYLPNNLNRFIKHRLAYLFDLVEIGFSSDAPIQDSEKTRARIYYIK